MAACPPSSCSLTASCALSSLSSSRSGRSKENVLFRRKAKKKGNQRKRRRERTSKEEGRREKEEKKENFRVPAQKFEFGFYRFDLGGSVKNGKHTEKNNTRDTTRHIMAEALSALARETEQALGKIWDQIGHTDDERSRELEGLRDALRSVLDDKIALEQRGADALAEQIAQVKADSMAAAVACFGKDSSQVKDLQPAGSDGGDMTLRARLAGAQAAHKQFGELRSERTEEISSQFAQLYKQWKTLGGSDSDEFARQFDALVICSREEREADLTRERIDQYATAVATAQGEIDRRQAVIDGHCATIQGLWGELKNQPGPGEGDDLDKRVARDGAASAEASPTTGQTRNVNNLVSVKLIADLEQKISGLNELKLERQARIKQLAEDITELWDLLTVDDAEREQFFAQHTGLGTDVITACEGELARRQAEKVAKLRELIMGMRETLTELWEELCTGDADRRADFPAAFLEGDSDFTDEALAAHDVHIGVLEKRAEKARSLIKLIQERDTILGEKAELDAANDDPDRLQSRKAGLNLIRETKMRERIAKRLPRFHSALRTQLTAWEAEQGERFKYQGRDILTEVDEFEAEEKAEEDARKQKMQQDREARKAAMGMGSSRGAAPAQARRTIAKARTTPSTAADSLNNSLSNSRGRRPARPGTARVVLSPKNASRIASAAKARRTTARTGAENTPSRMRF
jgi:Microtubule associated protein (MAP65/ASE1 family)